MLLPPDSVSKKDHKIQAQMDMLHEFFTNANPEISIARPYTVSPLAFKNFLMVDVNSAVRKRLLMRPGCLDLVRGEFIDL